ncbi:MAG: GNAT family N-acetyltransferase [Clostridia bacterium]|nr:GNAT family N-acetyltransferase [Clostridia bacterium]
MEIIQATAANIEDIYCITQQVIKESYKHYYPASVVDFIAEFHSKDRILADLETGQILLFKADDGSIAATGTAKGKEIGRLFVLPKYQGQGVGTLLMEALETIVFQEHDTVRLDASLSAKTMYLKRGYKEISYEAQPIGNGDFVCYSVMELCIRQARP